MMDKVFGLDTGELLDISHKLNTLGLDLKDLIEFLDRDKVQLFAELKGEIRTLRHHIHLAREALRNVDNA